MAVIISVTVDLELVKLVMYIRRLYRYHAVNVPVCDH